MLRPRSAGARRAALALALVLTFVFGALSLRSASARQQDAGAGAPPDAIAAVSYPKSIVVVRHAEKEAGPGQDPALSAAGTERAKALARLLDRAGVTDLFATPYRRTQETLLPLALQEGAKVQIVPPTDPGALLSALRSLPRGSVAVVAGHSNTVPMLVAELARGTAYAREHPRGPNLTEEDYDKLFVVTLWGDEGDASVLELRYGG